MGLENTSDKLTEKQNSELIKTSIKTKRQSLLIPSEITVTEEKEESMKLSRITLNKLTQKNDLPTNKCDSSNNSIYKKHLNNIGKINLFLYISNLSKFLDIYVTKK